MNYWNKLKTKLGITKNLATLGFSDLLGNGITSILWLYLASIMDSSVYGELHFMISIAASANLVSLFVTPTVVTVYVSKNLKLESTLYLISLLIGLISSIVIILVFSRIDVGLLVFAFIINDLSIAYLVGKKQYTSYAKYFLIQKIFAASLCILLYFLIGTTGIIYGLFISYLPFAIIIYKGFKDTKINFSELKSKKRFIISNYMIMMAGLFRNHIDKLVIGSFLGFSLLGNFALAAQIYTVFMIIPNIVIRFLLPDDSRGIQNPNLKKITILFSILISIFGIFISPYIISLLLPKYIDAITLIQIMSLGIPSSTLGLILSSKLLGTEKSTHVLIGRWISALIMIGGIFLLGSVYGTVGIAISFVLSNTLFAFYLTINLLRFNKSNNTPNGLQT